MAMKHFQFSGFGSGLGASLTDMLGPNFQPATVSPTLTAAPVARVPPTTTFTILGAEAPKATLDVAPKVAAAATEAAKDASDLAILNEAFQKARTGEIKPFKRGGDLMPPAMRIAWETRVREAAQRAAKSQALLEDVSPGTKLGAALKWAALPIAAGAIVIGMAPAGGKPIGAGLVVLGLSLGAFKYFKRVVPEDDERLEEE